MSRQFSRTAAALAALAAALLTAWNTPLAVAQQSPDAWSAERRAVLPSGLSVQFDFAASPGVAATAEAGRLADRTGEGRSAAVYTDGTHPGDAAQAFGITPDRPRTDGSWRTVGTLRLAFSRPVRNPRLHLSGLAAVATGKSGTTSTAARLTLTGGSPAAPSLVDRTDWSGWTVDGNSLAPAGTDGSSDGAEGSAAEGTLELAGTFRTAVFRVEERSTARDGSTTAPPVLRQAYTVTVDEALGTAPQAYGNVSHVVSDLFLGTDAAGSARQARGRSGAAAQDGPLVRLDHGESRRSPFAGVASTSQPGRGEYRGTDPSIGFPAEAGIGRYYRVTVPVAVSDQPATLAGWIDFGHTGRFDPADRVQTEVPAGADTATLEWTVPSGAASGETWARLRIARDTSQLVTSGGFADSGQVSDQRIRLSVGAERPQIADPVDGTAVSEARPVISGDGAVPGASVEIRDGDTTLCTAPVEHGGGWSCRPGTALAAGPHEFTPVETTSGGVVLRGEAVRIAVKTAPPGTPVLVLPAYTNDPGIQLTGTGDAGSVVSVMDRTTSTELCITAVRADGEWSCLPVENLADGNHLLAPAAVDAAGNRTEGQAVALVVATTPPGAPVLTSPARGEVLRVSRPKLTGRADPGASVLVTARAGAAGQGSAPAERTVLCGAAVALDGSWSCTANRDLPDGEQWLTVTSTDRAGNGTSAEPVRVRVAVAGTASGSAEASPAVPSPAAPSPAVPSPTPPAAQVPSPVASAPAVVSPTAAPVVPVVPVAPRPSPTVSAAPSVPGHAPVSSPSPTKAPVSSPSPTKAHASSPSPTKAHASSPSPTKAHASSPSPTRAHASSPSPTRAAASQAPVPSGLLPIGVPSATGAPAKPSVSASPAPSDPAASARPTAPSASAVAAVSAAPTRSAAPAPSAATTGGSPSAAATSPGARPSVVAVAAAEPPAAGRDASEAGDRLRPVPPAETETAGAAQGTSSRSGGSGWQGALAGVLLVLTGAGLITRRVVNRGPGARRR